MPSFRAVVVAVGMAYALYALVAAAALISVSAAPSDRWPVDFALIATITTTGLHFAFMGIAFARGSEPYPVRPIYAFILADCVAAAALGIASVVLVIDNETALPLDTLRAIAFTTSLLVGVTQLLCLAKAYALLEDVYAGRRDVQTGSWVGRYTPGPY